MTKTQTYQLRARAAADWAHSTDDPHLRFAWEQIAINYANLAQERLQVPATNANILNAPALQVGEDNGLRASILTTAMVWHEHAKRMCALALQESDKDKQWAMLAVSEQYYLQYYLLHGDLLALERTISHPTPHRAEGSVGPH